MKRKMFSMILPVAVLAVPLVAFAAADTSGLVSINSQGVGVGGLADGACSSPAIACAPAHTCVCLNGAETVVGNQGFNNGSFTFSLSIDQTNPVLPISNVGDCLPATGFATLKNSTGKVTLSLDLSGLACPTTEGAAEVFNGTYHVTGGSGGQNPFTAGTGAINGSLEGTVARTSLYGNVQR